MEGDNMLNIEVEKPRINPAHFIAILGSAAVAVAINAFLLGVGWNNLNNTIEDNNRAQKVLSDRLDLAQKELSDRFEKEASDRKDRQRIYQASMDNLNIAVGQIQPLQFSQTRMLEQITENKTANAETNKRIDSVVASFGGKLDNIGAVLGTLTTRLEVLNSKFDDQNPRTGRTSFVNPVIRPR